jgi:hypothetical protein
MMTIFMNRCSVLIVASFIRSIAPAVEFLQKTGWAILGESVFFVDAVDAARDGSARMVARTVPVHSASKLASFPEADVQSRH